jgi:hypothetical protein
MGDSICIKAHSLSGPKHQSPVAWIRSLERDFLELGEPAAELFLQSLESGSLPILNVGKNWREKIAAFP